jgi:hypothetical protein
MPEDETRKILGGNALANFGFDAEQLAAVAEKVGPSLESIRT